MKPILISFQNDDAGLKFIEYICNDMKDGSGVTLHLGQAMEDFYKEYQETKKNPITELNRLRTIFERLDKMHMPHSPDNRYGLMDSQNSLLEHTRAAINAALNKDLT